MKVHHSTIIVHQSPKKNQFLFWASRTPSLEQRSETQLNKVMQHKDAHVHVARSQTPNNLSSSHVESYTSLGIRSTPLHDYTHPTQQAQSSYVVHVCQLHVGS